MKKKELTVSEAGRKGGLISAKMLTPEERKKRGQLAIKKRWDNYRAKNKGKNE